MNSQSRLLVGGLAGVLATLPMTGLMLLGHRRLPLGERESLPPGQITHAAMAATAVDDDLPPDQRMAAAVANHFCYGAAMGSIYGLAMTSDVARRPVFAGVAYGLSVWAANYLGLLPALRLYRPATEEPPARNALMITAHLVWGASLGLLMTSISDGGHARRTGQHADAISS